MPFRLQLERDLKDISEDNLTSLPKNKNLYSVDNHFFRNISLHLPESKTKPTYIEKIYMYSQHHFFWCFSI